MKTGRTIQELAIEVDRQQKAKRDFLVNANQINAFAHEGKLELGFQRGDEELFTAPLTDNGHVQLGNFCDIPKKYYEAMRTYPGLLAVNVKHWLDRSSDRRMIRTLDGNIRAVLSDRYRRLDNYDLAQNVLPMLYEAQAHVESCDVTDNKFYIKAVVHSVAGEVKKGDAVCAGLSISNSETGHGSLSIKPMIYRLVCLNGATADDYANRKYHVGRRAEEDAQIEYSNETLLAEDKAFWLKVRDLVTHSLSMVTFDKIVNSMREASERRIVLPEKAIELVSVKHELSSLEGEHVLRHLIEGGDLTSWGLGNAVTRMSQDVESYDRATELESIGFKIMVGNWN